MKNFGHLFQQISDVQSKLQQTQQRLAEVEIIGESGGGMVGVVLGGDGMMKRLSLKLEPEYMQEPGIVEDLIVAAHNDAKRKLDARMAEESQQTLQELGLPAGLKFPL